MTTSTDRLATVLAYLDIPDEDLTGYAVTTHPGDILTVIVTMTDATALYRVADSLGVEPRLWGDEGFMILTAHRNVLGHTVLLTTSTAQREAVPA